MTLASYAGESQRRKFLIRDFFSIFPFFSFPLHIFYPLPFPRIRCPFFPLYFRFFFPFLPHHLSHHPPLISDNSLCFLRGNELERYQSNYTIDFLKSITIEQVEFIRVLYRPPNFFF